jgi:uncharacterized membrane protein YqhA
MEKSSIGRFAIVIGSLFLSLQLYGLIILQLLDKQSGSWQNAFDYARETPVMLSLLITIAVILYGIVLVIGTEKIKKSFIN